MQNYLLLFPDVDPLWIRTCMDIRMLYHKYLRKNIVHFIVEWCE